MFDNLDNRTPTCRTSVADCELSPRLLAPTRFSQTQPELVDPATCLANHGCRRDYRQIRWGSPMSVLESKIRRRQQCCPYRGITKVALRTFFGPPGYRENPVIDASETQASLPLPQSRLNRSFVLASNQSTYSQAQCILDSPLVNFVRKRRRPCTDHANPQYQLRTQRGTSRPTLRRPLRPFSPFSRLTGRGDWPKPRKAID